MLKTMRRSVFFRWVISYIVILTAAILLCAMIAVNARQLLIDQYTAGSESVRTLSSRLLDTYLNGIYAQQQQYIQNETLGEFINRDQPYSGSDRYLLVEFKKQLQNYTIYAGGIASETYVYLRKLNQCIDWRTIYDMPLLMTVYHADLQADSREMQEMLSAYHGRDFVTMPTTDGRLSVMLLSSLPNSPLYEPWASIVQKLDSGFFSSLLLDSMTQMGMDMYLVDESGQVISASGSRELAEELLPQGRLNRVGRQEVTVQNEKYIVSIDSATVPKWYYVTVISHSALNAKAGMLNRTALLVCLFCLSIGAVMSYFLARWQYRPMARVLNRLSGRYDHRAEGNEYDMILSALDSVDEARRNIDRLWQQQTLSLRQEFLSSLLQGDIAGDITRMADMLDIPLQDHRCCVMLFSVYGADEIEGADALLDKAVSECVEAASARGALCYPVGGRDPRAVVLLLEANGAEACRESICSDVLAIVSRPVWSAWLLASVSYVSGDFGALNLCALDAGFILDEKRSLRRNGGHLPQELNVSGLYRLDHSGHAATAICMAVKNGNAQEASERLEQMLDSCPDHLEPTQHMLLTSLLADVLASIPSAAQKEEEYARLPEREALLMRRATRRDEVRQILMESIRAVSAACASERSSSLMAAILSCVDQHCAETDFNVSRVAQLMDMSISYLSQYFREQSGIGLLEYINRMRVNRAKALIHSGEVSSITQVAQQVGFDNLNSFIRVFKKYEGVTPGEYRKARGDES